MYLNLNPGTVGIGGLSFTELADLAARHGFDAVECPAASWGGVEEAERAGAYLRGKALRWGLFGMPFEVSSCTDEQYAAGMERLRGLLPLVKAAGCTRTYNHIWPGSKTLSPDDYAAFLVGRLTPLAELLGDHGVRYGLEFLGPKHLRDAYPEPTLYTLPEMARLADRLPSNVGIVLDTFHWHTSGGTPNDIRAHLSDERIVCVHLNDARPGRAPEEQQDMERALPGETGVIDLKGFVGALNELAYDGPVIVEPFEPNRGRLGALPPDEAAAEVVSVMRKALGRA